MSTYEEDAPRPETGPDGVLRWPEPKRTTKAAAKRKQRVSEDLAQQVVGRVLHENRVDAPRPDVAAYIKDLVDKAPPLSEAQRDRIRQLFKR